MNIQPGRKKQISNTSSARKDPAFALQVLRVITVIFCLVLITGVLMVHIYMNQIISETGREIRAVKSEISRVKIELGNLNNQYEQSCSPEFISRQIKRFGLKFVSPEPGQVRRMPILSVSQARQIAMRMERGRSDRAYLNRRNSAR